MLARKIERQSVSSALGMKLCDKSMTALTQCLQLQHLRKVQKPHEIAGFFLAKEQS